MGRYVDTSTSIATLMPATTFDTATTSLVDKCITWAEAEVDKYIGKRYDISGSPFDTNTTAPPVVKSIAEQLSVGYAWRTMSRGSKESLGRADAFIKPALENLRAIADYDLAVADSSGSLLTEQTNTSFTVKADTDSYHTTFDEDDPLNWGVDSDKLDDISDGRD